MVERPKEDENSDVIVGIEKLVGMAHLVQDRQNYRKWYVNNRIDLWTFKKFPPIYEDL